jgi:hypothetical protein
LAAAPPRFVVRGPELELVDGTSSAPGVGEAGWLRCSFGEQGEPHLSEASAPTLIAEVKELAELTHVRAGSKLALNATPLAGQLSRELLLPLVSGAAGYLAAADAQGMDALVQLLDEPNVTLAFATPATWLEYSAAEGPPLPELTAIVSGAIGELLGAQLLPLVGAAWSLRSVPGSDVAFAGRAQEQAEAGRIGLPLAASAAVLSERQQPVPLGVAGLLTLSGHGLARPVRARRRSDGSIELLLATGDALELGDFPFFASEVAAELARHAAVATAFVRVEQAENGGARLVAYFAPRPGASFTETELRRHLRGLLPEDMVPKRFVQLPSLPLNGDGKVDESKLPSPFAAAQIEFVAPRTENERAIAELFCEALNLPRVSVYDNFFDLGGHSLLCFRVLERIEKRLHVRLSPRVLLLNSLEQVAAQLQPQAAAAGSAAPAPPPTSGEPGGLKGRVLKKLQGFWRG